MMGPSHGALPLIADKIFYKPRRKDFSGLQIYCHISIYIYIHMAPRLGWHVHIIIWQLPQKEYHVPLWINKGNSMVISLKALCVD